MKKDLIIRKTNIVLTGTVMLLGVSVLGATLHQVKAQDAPRPSSCEAIIDMTRSCEEPYVESWASNTYLICKTGSGSESNWCCEYRARTKWCKYNTYSICNGGYKAIYDNAYVTPLVCGGTIQGQCS